MATGEYTAPTTFVHGDANGVNDASTTFTYTVKDTDTDSPAGTGSQTIRLDDTLPTLADGTASSVHEQHLSTGTSPSSAQLTKTGSFAATQQQGAIDVTFKASQANLDDLITSKGFSSSGHGITYALSNGGHTLTASANGQDVFVVTITNPSSPSTVGYSFELKKPLDHEELVLTGQDIDISFDVIVTDDDNDTDTAVFTVKIEDDTSPGNQAMTVLEDSLMGDNANTLNTNADATQANTTITSVATHGAASINANGKLNYVPNGNFSGTDSVTYKTTLDDGSTSTTTVAITVTPVADAPTFAADKTLNTTEDDNNTKEGANSQALELDLAGTK